MKDVEGMDMLNGHQQLYKQLKDTLHKMSVCVCVCVCVHVCVRECVCVCV